TKNYKQFSV
nr:Chain B, Cysteine-rich PDZ-binding protein [Rattus norvegicus]5HF1_B Chain B, Cysteine-rich PDZ-binding protein [Rattus norvegicus]5HFC_B Chain B, Cysteine-rich PDZ-binding protein [Rattus norvegicus]5HFF_B Chain B, Cysteine-rich PDZ-binding protein [Rattus norvegicus]